MPKSRSRSGALPFRPKAGGPQPIVIHPAMLGAAKQIAKVTGTPVGDVISTCIAFTMNSARNLNTELMFAEALRVPPEQPPAPQETVADPDAAATPPSGDEQSNETAEERLAKTRALARGEDPEASRETPAAGTIRPS